jgi:hypothetical protein
MPRRSDFRELKKTMLIVVEGETELIYFNQLKAEHRLSNLSIEPKVSPRKDPLSIVERAERENLHKEFDYTWCVFDLDTVNSNRERHESAQKKAKDNDYFLAESFPCFEIWFLFHFFFTTKQFEKCSQVVS